MPVGAIDRRSAAVPSTPLFLPVIRQREATRDHAGVVRWLDELPERMHGVVIGNEVLDAMPVDLLHFDGAAWLDRA